MALRWLFEHKEGSQLAEGERRRKRSTAVRSQKKRFRRMHGSRPELEAGMPARGERRGPAEGRLDHPS